MTVNELIEKLQALTPEERELTACFEDDSGFFVEIDAIDRDLGMPNSYRGDYRVSQEKIVLLS